MITKHLIIYALCWMLAIAAFKIIHDVIYEKSFDWISCGEALNRANGSAAPRDIREVQMWNECLFGGRTRWPDNYLK